MVDAGPEPMYAEKMRVPPGVPRSRFALYLRVWARYLALA